MRGNGTTRAVAALAAGIILAAGNAGASEIVIPVGTRTIEAEAFAGCGSVRTVVIPDSVTEIGEDAFLDCSEAVLIRAGAGSAGAAYARDHQLDYMAGTEYRALIIGQDYTGTENELNGPVNDRQAVVACLGALTTTNYSVIDVRANLSPEGITDAIGSCFAGADSNDVSLFYYSGHGETDGSLMGADSGFSPLTPAALRAALDQVPGRKIVIVDACNSGKLIEGENGGDSLNRASGEDAGAASFVNAFQAAFRTRTRGALNSGSYFVITAARGTEYSMEGTIKSGGMAAVMGYFTYGFCLGCGWNGVTGAAGSLRADANGDEAVSVGEAFSWAAGIARTYNSGQHAVAWPEDCRWFAPFRK